MAKVNAVQREARDQLVFQLFLGGHTYRAIARHAQVQLSVRGVELAIKRQLTLRQRSLVNNDTHADAVQIERFESLYRVAYGKAMNGDMRAQEQCRRLLIELGRLRGLDAAAALSFPPPPPVDEDDDDGIGEDGLDDLQRYRLQYEAKYGS